MTARWHVATPAVVDAVTATEPCPECGDEKLGTHTSPCPTCGSRHIDRHRPSLVGGWLTLPWPVQPGDELRMVVEEWRMLHLGGYCGDHPSEWFPVEDGDPEADGENFERRQVWFATVTVGKDGHWCDDLRPLDWQVRVASVVLHDPPVVTMQCPCECHATGDDDAPDCPDCGGSGSVPLSVNDGEVAS